MWFAHKTIGGRSSLKCESCTLMTMRECTTDMLCFYLPVQLLVRTVNFDLLVVYRWMVNNLIRIGHGPMSNLSLSSPQSVCKLLPDGSTTVYSDVHGNTAIMQFIS